MGLALAAQLSHHKNWVDFSSLKRICRLLTKISLPIGLPKSIHPDELLSTMHMDKKIANERLHLILLEGLGYAVFSEQVDDRELKVFLANA
nr:hypothetical protein [Coxiella endosymbiont of Ornithodoros amblus]